MNSWAILSNLEAELTWCMWFTHAWHHHNVSLQAWNSLQRTHSIAPHKKKKNGTKQKTPLKANHKNNDDDNYNNNNNNDDDDSKNILLVSLLLLLLLPPSPTAPIVVVIIITIMSSSITDLNLPSPLSALSWREWSVLLLVCPRKGSATVVISVAWSAASAPETPFRISNSCRQDQPCKPFHSIHFSHLRHGSSFQAVTAFLQTKSTL